MPVTNVDAARKLRKYFLKETRKSWNTERFRQTSNHSLHLPSVEPDTKDYMAISGKKRKKKMVAKVIQGRFEDKIVSS